MTTDEFLILRPDLSHLEGDDLWDAMTNYMLRKQEGEEIMKRAVPFFKRYQFRWLFYRHPKGSIRFGKNDYSSDKRCNQCKKGTGGIKLCWFGIDGGFTMCPHCGKKLTEENNNNLNHILWSIGKYFSTRFWWIMDKTHIVRKWTEQRYGMFGDEGRYVKSWTLNTETGEIKYNFKNRKWWEYILIERKFFNF